jgi:hypothetical protein
MRYGYWLPVFGGWLRNVDDERMESNWDYNSRLARRSEQIGSDLTLIAEFIRSGRRACRSHPTRISLSSFEVRKGGLPPLLHYKNLTSLF